MPASVITSEELYMLRVAMLLPLMLKMIESSLEKTEASANIMKRALLMSGEYIALLVRNDLSNIEQQLKASRIIHWEKGSTKHVLVHRYVCRGAEESFSITRDEVRSELSILFGNYSTRFGQLIQK